VADLGRHARQLGLPAVSIMTPWFYGSSQADVLAHFLHAADASGLPVFLYNFPELTGVRIDIETAAAFAERARMAGIKQSGGEFDYHKDLVRLGREKNFAVLSGADVRLPEVFALGATGCIGGLGNVAPELMLHIYRICREDAPGDVAEAAQRLRTIVDHIVKLPFPWSIAAAMSARGLPVGVPKAVFSPESQAMSAQAAIDLRKCFIEWGMPLFEGI
jgi:4-hydroxy-tetrahydrodipicolinate synthase